METQQSMVERRMDNCVHSDRMAIACFDLYVVDKKKKKDKQQSVTCYEDNNTEL